MAENNISAVIDASVIISLLVPDESPPPILLELSDQIIHQGVIINAPTLIDYEVTNMMHLAVLRKRFSSLIAQKYLKDFFKLKINRVLPNFNQAFILAQKHQISVYDATYLELSMRLQQPLYTLDHHLSRLTHEKVS